MAQRIDSEFVLPAHTALELMFCRAQIAANRDRLRVGVVCDLEGEEFLLVNLGNGSAAEAQCLRVFEPVHEAGPVRDVTVDAMQTHLAGNKEVAIC